MKLVMIQGAFIFFLKTSFIGVRGYTIRYICSRPSPRGVPFIHLGTRDSTTVGWVARLLSSPISTTLQHHVEKNDPLPEGDDSSITTTKNEWTLAEDQTLWKYHMAGHTLPQLSARLGRGLRDTQERLLLQATPDTYNIPSHRLTPAHEILRRIVYDPALDATHYVVRYYDRVADTLVDCPVMANNTSITSPHRTLIDALPEHRIMAILYRERVVWERETKMDLFSSSIEQVQTEYATWQAEQQGIATAFAERKEQTLRTLREAMGDEAYAEFLQLTRTITERVLQDAPDRKRKKTTSPKVQVETYVDQVLVILRNGAYKQMEEALDVFSEVAALQPQEKLRQLVLDEIYLRLSSLQGKKATSDRKSMPTLPELNEDDLEESFVRGSGPGGQKINKTSNRVVLVHIPTQLRVECQDTRSLPQNRKLARKRLRVKLDAYWNGSQSQSERKAQKAKNKRQKAKARSRARLRKKQMTKEETTTAANERD